MPQEEDFRRLQAEVEGIDPRHGFDYGGRSWELSGDGLIALLRYATLAQSHTAAPRNEPEDPKAQENRRIMAATHRVLEDCIASFAEFQEAAIAGKITEAEVKTIVERILEILTARPAPAATRLMSWAVGNLGELDGKLLMTTGEGVSTRSARQLCNIAFTTLVSGVEEEQRADFISDLNAREDPQQVALRLALEMIEEKKKAAEASGEAPEPKKEGLVITEKGITQANLTEHDDFTVELD